MSKQLCSASSLAARTADSDLPGRLRRPSQDCSVLLVSSAHLDLHLLEGPEPGPGESGRHSSLHGLCRSPSGCIYLPSGFIA